MLDIRNLTVAVGDNKADGHKTILKDLSLNVEDGEVHVIFGPNGSGKTTLVQTLLGYPGYTIEEGTITFNGTDITTLSINERANLGLGVVFQYPPAVRGVKLNDMANLVSGHKGSDEIFDETAEYAKKLNMTEFLNRDVNHGFSGGEKKRAEVLQVLLQSPQMLLLDEPDSGVDVENVEIIGRMLNKFLQRDLKPMARKKSAIIITHLGYLLNFVKTDRAHVLCNGQFLCSGDSKEIYENILKNGFDKCENSCLYSVREEDANGCATKE
ncbi:MAG TPA: ABC transporter ATP-binding protein [Candidatus Lokiarchaeia archaeon]|nr:ABC transporter ATP-binding protein [Candidatus Lokiarchaeia archaeon]